MYVLCQSGPPYDCTLLPLPNSVFRSQQLHPFNENKPQQIHGVSQCFHAPLKPKANNVNVNDFIELRWE